MRRGTTIRGQPFTAYTIPARVRCLYEFCTLLKMRVLYTFFLAKNTGTYFPKKPANPHKIKVSCLANKPSPHDLSSQSNQKVQSLTLHSPLLQTASNPFPKFRDCRKYKLPFAEKALKRSL